MMHYMKIIDKNTADTFVNMYRNKQMKYTPKHTVLCDQSYSQNLVQFKGLILENDMMLKIVWY